MRSPLTAKTFSSLDLKGLQALLMASMGMLLNTSMLVVIRDCFLWEGLLLPLLDTPHCKLSNGFISREPGGQTFVPWGRFLLRMWKTVSVKGNFICFLNFSFSIFPHTARIILTMTALWFSFRGPFNLAAKWTPESSSRWSGGYTVKILPWSDKRLMQETILKNGRQYPSHPVLTYSVLPPMSLFLASLSLILLYAHNGTYLHIACFLPCPSSFPLCL